MDKPQVRDADLSRGGDFVVRLCDGVQVSKTEEGLARIGIPRARSGFQGFLSFIFRLADHRILVLDETGTAFLSLINGRRRVSEFVAFLAETHSMERVLAERSVEAFLHRLMSEGVVERI